MYTLVANKTSRLELEQKSSEFKSDFIQIVKVLTKPAKAGFDLLVKCDNLFLGGHDGSHRMGW